MKKKRLRLDRVLILIAILMLITEIACVFAIKYEKEKIVVEALARSAIEMPKQLEPKVFEINVPDIEIEKQDVYFTCYYPSDNDGSTNKTGSGLTTNDFEINELGWYTYNGYIVLASATYEGLASSYGVLANYNEPDSDITYYHYGDVIEFEIDGSQYIGQVLDTCGKSYDRDFQIKYDDGLNIIDIYMADKKFSFGKKKGAIIYGAE